MRVEPGYVPSPGARAGDGGAAMGSVAPAPSVIPPNASARSPTCGVDATPPVPALTLTVNVTLMVDVCPVLGPTWPVVCATAAAEVVPAISAARFSFVELVVVLVCR